MEFRVLFGDGELQFPLWTCYVVGVCGFGLSGFGASLTFKSSLGEPLL